MEVGAWRLSLLPQEWGVWKIFSQKRKSSSRDGAQDPDLEGVLVVGDGNALPPRQTLPGIRRRLMGLTRGADLIDQLGSRHVVRAESTAGSAAAPSGFSPVDAGMAAPRFMAGDFALWHGSSWQQSSWRPCPPSFFGGSTIAGAPMNYELPPFGRAGYPATSGSVDQEQRIGIKRRAQRRRGGLFRIQGALVTVWKR